MTTHPPLALPRALLLAATLALSWLVASPAGAWTYQRTHEHDLDSSEYNDAGRIGCGLVQAYGPSKAPHQIRVEIPKSPYGPLTVYMGWERRLRIIVSTEKYRTKPDEAAFQDMFEWLLQQLPKAPAPCDVYLAEPETAVVALNYPKGSKLVDDAQYVAVQLEMAGKAMALGDVSLSNKFYSGAYGMFSSKDLSKAERRKLRKDPRMREAAYNFVEVPAPDGITDIVRNGYCSMYRFTAEVFPPRTKDERFLFRVRRKALSCPRN